ncbi:MAG: hypothetical protein HQL73_10530 [Magnetococcales bacterium]|nr:hypothetical protein [Magnetococcales bacterium]
MAATEPILFAVEGARQVAQLGSMAGKTYMVGQAASVGTGVTGSWLFLQPVGEVGAAAAKKTVAIKLEGARQMASLSGLAGKTVTVAKAPMTVGGACHWLALNPVSAAGAATAPGTAAGLTMVKLEGARQAAQLTSMAGQSFTVIPSPLAGAKAGDMMFLQPASGSGKIIALKVQANAGTATSSSLVGKSFVLGKTPVMAGKGGSVWLMFKPAGGAVLAKGGACMTAGGLGAGMGGCPMAKMQTVALGTPPAGAAPLMKGGAAASAPAAALGKTGVGTAAKTAGGGVIWKGTGTGLGLGLGLGPWGPAILLGAALAGVGVYSYLKRNRAEDADTVEAVTV